MRRPFSCRFCRGALKLIAHTPGPTRAGREHYQCEACADLTWRDIPDLPSYRLRGGGLPAVPNTAPAEVDDRR